MKFVTGQLFIYIVINCFRFFIASSLCLLLSADIFAAEKDLIDLAESFNKRGEYYNAVTEIMRYQYVYPAGIYYPQSMLILSEAYYKGGNYYKTINTLTECHERFRNIPEGEKALYDIGYVRLVMGSPYFALRSYQEYMYIYKDGQYKEDVTRDLCYTLTLMKDFKGAKEAAGDYEKNYFDGKYMEEIKGLRLLIDGEINRPRKSVWVSVLGSIIVPGFGHFYTGKYKLGIFSLATNAAFIYLFYDGYKDKSNIRMMIFGLAEFSVYQYSIYSSISNVYEYNSNEEFYKSVRLSAEKEF